MEHREKLLYLAESLPTKHWLTVYGTREVEKRLRSFGLSQRLAKIAISKAKQELN